MAAINCGLLAACSDGLPALRRLSTAPTKSSYDMPRFSAQNARCSSGASSACVTTRVRRCVSDANACGTASRLAMASPSRDAAGSNDASLSRLSSNLTQMDSCRLSRTSRHTPPLPTTARACAPGTGHSRTRANTRRSSCCSSFLTQAAISFRLSSLRHITASVLCS